MHATILMGIALDSLNPNLRSSAYAICNLTTGQSPLAHNDISCYMILLSQFMDEKSKIVKRYTTYPKPNDYKH